MKRNISHFRSAGLCFAFAAGSIVIAAALSGQAYAQAACAFAAGSVGAPVLPTGAGSFNCGPGAGAGSTASTNLGNTAVGTGAGVSVTGNVNTVNGFEAGDGVTGNGNTATGAGAGGSVIGSNNTATGSGAGIQVRGSNNTAIGVVAGFDVSGSNNIASGFSAGNHVIGSGNTASGTGAGSMVAGINNIAIGTNAGSGQPGSSLLVNNTIAVGNNALATADNAISIGLNAASTGQNAIAIGNNVTTTRANQVSVGNAANQYTFAGITSSTSAALQTGPLQVVTSDINGNLATDGGQIFNEIRALQNRTNRLGAGIAIASSLANPDRTGDQTWALATNWGNFDRFNAFSLTGIAAISSSVFIPGDQISIGGAIGFSTDQNQVAGRVSLQIAGGSVRPLK